jgi:hypothetical protein
MLVGTHSGHHVQCPLLLSSFISKYNVSIALSRIPVNQVIRNLAQKFSSFTYAEADERGEHKRPLLIKFSLLTNH